MTASVESVELPESAGEVSLLDLLTAIGEAKTFIALFVLVCCALAALVSFLLPVQYTAKTLLIPPQQQQSAAAAALANLGGLAGLAGGLTGVKTADETYVAFLKSEHVSDAIIRRFDLKTYYDESTFFDTRKQLARDVRILSEKKSGLVSIEVDHHVPERAAEIANAYVEELRKLLGRVAVTEAQQRRMFLEGQIQQTKERLSQSEMTLREQQSKSGLLSLDAQTQGAMRASVELRTQIAQREVQLSTLRVFATAENADVQRLSAELAGLRAQLARLEQGAGSPASATATLSADSAQSPAPQGLKTVRAYREVKYQEAVLDALVRQYELAKVDEAREGPLLQQVSEASVPERKSRPRRLLILVGALFGSLFLGLFVALFRSALRTVSSQPKGAQKLAALKRAWSWR